MGAGKKTFNQNFDIGGPDVLSYKQMLLGFAKSRNLSRQIFVCYYSLFLSLLLLQLSTRLMLRLIERVKQFQNKTWSLMQGSQLGVGVGNDMGIGRLLKEAL